MRDRREELPGRRASDEELEVIAREVRVELAKMRRRWLVVWVLTLVLSAVAWRIASDANDTAQRTADQAVHQSDRARKLAAVQCVRSKRFLPYFTEVLLKDSSIAQHPDDLRDYRTLIQPHC